MILDDNTKNFLSLLRNCCTLNNMRLFLVGGCVRDFIMNNAVKDIDIITEGNSLELINDFPSEITVKSIHTDFSTLKIQYKNMIFDLASTRTESYPYSGCLPFVDKVGVKIEEDYKRRDFTINSLYMEVLEDDFRLIDFCKGEKDIKSKLLCSLYDKSYIDDPTRILRGLDFKYRFGFDFSNHDKILIQQYLKNPNIENSSYDRTLSVFKKILSNESQDKIFREIMENKYYKTLVNEICADFSAIEKVNLNTKDKCEFYLNILKNTNIEKLKTKDDCEIIRNFSKLNMPDIFYYFYKTKDKNALKYLKIKDIKLFITGNDLINLGYCQGKTLGKILHDLYCQKLKNPNLFKTKEDEINWVSKNCN